MISKSEKKELRKQAQTMRAIFQIGKEGISENQVKAINDALEAHECIKLSCLKTCPNPLQEIALDLSYATHSEIVQIIGKTLVIYRKNPKRKKATIQ